MTARLRKRKNDAARGTKRRAASDMKTTRFRALRNAEILARSAVQSAFGITLESDWCVITKRLKFGSLLLMAANAAVAQAPPKAIGQPRLIEPYGVLASTVVHHNSEFPAFLAAGIHKPITNPSIGLFGIAAEFYLPLPSRLDFSGTTPGVRALLTSRALGLSGGIDFDITSEKNLTGLFSFQTAIRRGGILGRGTMVRLDWYPWRDHELSAGIFLPIAHPFAGRTRSRDTDVDPPLSPVRSPLRPARLPARAEAALSAIGRAATMIL